MTSASSHHDESRPLLLDGDTESQPQSQTQSQRRRDHEDGGPPPSPQLSTSSSLLSSRPPVHFKRRLRSLVPSLSTLNVINDSSQARDHLASERTFLAWIRTSLTLASIGIALAHFVGTGGVGPEDRGGVIGPDSMVGRAWEAEGSRGSEYMQYVMIRNLVVEMEQMETRIRELEQWKEKKLAESEIFLSDDEAKVVAGASLQGGAQESRFASPGSSSVASGSTLNPQLPFQGVSSPTLEPTISNSSSDSSKHGRGRTHVRTSLSAFAKPLGCSFVTLGLLTLGLGTRRYFIVQKRLSEGKMAASRGETATMSLLVGALLVAILASILGTIAVEHSG